MLLKNHQAAIVELMAEGQGLLSDMEMPDLAGELEEQARLCMTRDVPVIMFYGMYNAGKSTLSNALCQKYVAKVGDVPTTASVQQVPWDGYTLIDTPGINANGQHTRIATGEIDRTDVVLFVVDNSDGFELEIAAQAVVEIMHRGKAVAIVINQKHVDENEDADVPVSHRRSMLRVSDKVLENLNRQASAQGLGELSQNRTFLGICLVNAQDAFEASGLDPDSAALLRENSGINSLVNIMEQSIRQSSAVRMLLTPATFLREKLKDALAACEQMPISGELEKCTREHQILVESRQRTGNRLKAEGMRRIEAAFEEIQAKGARNEPFDQVSEQLQQDLTELIRSVAAQESEIVTVEVKKLDLPAPPTKAQSVSSPASDSSSLSDTAAVAAAGTLIPDIPIVLPDLIPIPSILPEVLIRVVIAIAGFLFGDGQEDTSAPSDDSRMADYYKWRNDIRDREVQVKANYTAAVEDFLKNHFDEPLGELEHRLSQAGEACRKQTEYVRKVGWLLVRTDEEIAELSLAL